MTRLTRHEKPLSKSEGRENNPNKITINQHVIPRKHILEWSTDGKMVYTYDIKCKELKNLPATSPYFCVMRLWDQWTESEILKSNEDNYQSQIKLIRKGLQPTNPEYITAYYLLLCIRIWIANKERPHYPSKFSTINYESSKSDLEDNELEMEGPAHVIKGTLDPNSQHIARQVVKMAINQTFLKWSANWKINIKEHNWKIYQSDNENFILSDALYANYLDGIHVIPITPKQVLIAWPTYEFLIKNDSLSARFINKIMKQNAVNYYITNADLERRVDNGASFSTDANGG